MDLLEIDQNSRGVEFKGADLASRLALGSWHSLRQSLALNYPGLSLGAWCGPAVAAPPRQRLQAFLEELGRLIDPGLRQWLASSSHVLGIKVPEDFFPWEWLTAGVRPLWHCRPPLRHFGRQSERPPAPLSKDRSRILACLDCHQTMGSLRPNLESLGAAHLKLLEGPQASMANLARELNGSAYDVLILSCWLEWNPLTQRLGLALADGVARREILQEVLLCSLPPVVILGTFWPSWDHTPLEMAQALEELAELLGRLGTRLVIGNLWPFPEWPAQIVDLLQGAMHGRSLLSSLHRVRLQHAQLSPGPWMGEWSWLAWGEDDLSLPGPSSAGTKVSAIRPTHALEVEEGAEPGRRFELMLTRGRQIYLGRPGLKGIDVSLPSDIVENRTASLSRSDDGLLLCNLTDNSQLVFVNGLAVQRDCPVFSGDRLRLGDQLLILQELGERAAVAAPARAQLQVVRWDLPSPPLRASIPLSALVNTLGRSNECHVVIPDGSVSRVHAAFKYRGEGYYVSALGSNPVLVNGVVVDGERELESGDSILISEAVELVYRWEPT